MPYRREARRLAAAARENGRKALGVRRLPLEHHGQPEAQARHYYADKLGRRGGSTP